MEAHPEGLTKEDFLAGVTQSHPEPGYDPAFLELIASKMEKHCDPSCMEDFLVDSIDKLKAKAVCFSNDVFDRVLSSEQVLARKPTAIEEFY